MSLELGPSNPSSLQTLTPQKVRPHLYSPGYPHAHLPGGYKASEDCQAFEAFEAVEQIHRHFQAVDSELASWETSKHVS